MGRAGFEPGAMGHWQYFNVGPIWFVVWGEEGRGRFGEKAAVRGSNLVFKINGMSFVQLI